MIRHLLLAFALLIVTTGCASLEAQWDRVWTPDARERAEAKADELRAELDALAETVEADLREEVRRIVIDGIVAP